MPEKTTHETELYTGATGHRAVNTTAIYIPFAGLALTLLAIIFCSLGIYFWPAQKEFLFIFQIVLAAIGLLLITYITRRVKIQLTTPLSLLHDWAQRMSSGDFSPRLPQIEHGEFAPLVKNANRLGETLRSLTREMDDKVKRQTIPLQRKTRSLEILYDVAARSNTAKDIDELLITFLNTLTEIVYAHAGTVRLVTDDHQMRLVGSVGLDEDSIKKVRLVPIEHCLCAQEFSKNMLLCQNHFNNCGNVVSELLFSGDKLDNIAIPLRYNNRTLGIYNLFVEKLGLSEREDIKDILTNIGQHLSMAITKSHWDAESHRLSIMQERTMLAHELHDSLAQTLASLRFRVSMLQKTLNHDDHKISEATSEVEQIKLGLDEANFELRELLAHFRIRMDERGLIPAIEGLIERFRNEGDNQVFFQNECPELRLPPVLEVHLLHIIQEALANIRKHSAAKHVRVMLTCSQQHLIHLLIEDDGKGINAEINDAVPGEHVGLTIMRERAQRIGAELTIESDPGEGTRVELALRYADKPSKLENSRRR